MENYYNEMVNLIENLEVNTNVAVMKNNLNTLETYWNIGKLIVASQGGKQKAIYGDEIIKKWSLKLSQLYGQKYDESNLKRFRKFYLIFPKGAARAQLTWTHVKLVLPIENGNERNYYLNEAIKKDLSTRELEKLIQNKTFQKLPLKKQQNIKLIESSVNIDEVVEKREPEVFNTEKENYLEVIELIENLEASISVEAIKNNEEIINTYWQIGKILVKAQGGEKRAKYGNELIKKWGLKLEKLYGSKYSITNLKYMRRFYLTFPKLHARAQLTWTHYKHLLSIKNENERNYYINEVLLNGLSSRELLERIKSDAFNRLALANKNNIKIINNEDYTLKIEDLLKDPIILNPHKSKNIKEKSIHKLIIELLENRFLELGAGFGLMGHEYKLYFPSCVHYADLVFFNVKLNCYIVMEIKNRALRPGDISELEFYVNYVDHNIKEKHHQSTLGILIVKKNNKYVMEYMTNKKLYVTTFKLEDKSPQK